MDYSFLKGCSIGLAIAAPVGPIGVLCIRRSLEEGARVGFATGLGAAVADAFYGGVAAFGLTTVSSFLTSQQTILRAIGGGFLIILGLRAFRAKPAKVAAQPNPRHQASAFISTLFLTITNPATIFSFIAIFAGAGLSEGNYSVRKAALLTVGVFTGSAVWWLLLSQAAAYYREHLTERWMLEINHLSGLLLLEFGGFVLEPLFESLGRP
jgi:threonine/homoserine/homoserine lactone efflux protein